MKVHPPISFVPQNRLRSVTSPTKLLKIVADKEMYYSIYKQKEILAFCEK